jgi:hypothetical protein
MVSACSPTCNLLLTNLGGTMTVAKLKNGTTPTGDPKDQFVIPQFSTFLIQQSSQEWYLVPTPGEPDKAFYQVVTSSEPIAQLSGKLANPGVH